MVNKNSGWWNRRSNIHGTECLSIDFNESIFKLLCKKIYIKNHTSFLTNQRLIWISTIQCKIYTFYSTRFYTQTLYERNKYSIKR